MPAFRRSCTVSCLALIVFCAAEIAYADAPATIVWEAAHLERVREAVAASPTEPELPSQVVDSLESLRAAANAALRRGPYSVVDKVIVPPSGDKHDYMSFSRYWWPNPDTPDGLPYVRRDGVVNRELLAQGDRNRIGDFYDDFEALALAAYLLDPDRYGPPAARLLRVWFLEPATKMNPNLKYGQAVPGVAEGRGPGVIDTRHFVRVLDGIALLQALKHLDASEVDALHDWFGAYLDWLCESDLGLHEQRADNNHGVWYDAQTAAMALFVGRRELAESIVRRTRDDRIADSIEADGRQPEELERTKSLHYSLFALSAYAVVARVGEQVGIDLWQHAAANDASLGRAMEYAAPYIVRAEEWPHPRIDRFSLSDRQSHVFILAASRLNQPKYLGLMQAAPTRYRGRRLAPLLFATAWTDEAEER